MTLQQADFIDHSGSARNQGVFIERHRESCFSSPCTQCGVRLKRGDKNMRIKSLLLLLAVAGGPVLAGDEVNQYVIERDIPGASEMSADELKAIAQKSRDVLESLGPEIKWQHSYVAEDKIYCVYTAPNKELIQEHAELGGFPANRISKVNAVIDLSTAD
jgi:hypothetical protein